MAFMALKKWGGGILGPTNVGAKTRGAVLL